MPARYKLITCFLAGVVAASFYACTWAAEPHGNRLDDIHRIRTARRVVALTFDDGPDPRYTPQVLQIAREKNIKVTFFLVGRAAKLYPDLVREVIADGHAIGNHTWSHPVLPFLSREDNLNEIRQCQAELERITGRRPELFRPPKGMYNRNTAIAAKREGFDKIILWTQTLNYFSARTAEAKAARIINAAVPGMIILAHDGMWPANRDEIMRSLPILIDGLKRKGYEFVTIPELLEMESRKD